MSTDQNPSNSSISQSEASNTLEKSEVTGESENASTSKHNIIVKWMGKEYEIDDISQIQTVGELKIAIKEKTGVNPERQKLLNLNLKGKQVVDSCQLSNLSLKVGFKIMMMGSLEKDIETVDVPPEDRPQINNDLDIPSDDEVEQTESRGVYLAKIDRRIKEYNLSILHPTREGKKLLVLDIDFTIYDNHSPGQTIDELMRPGLHQFLQRSYNHYDIAIWSANSYKWIVEKMRVMGTSSHPSYKLSFYVDYLAMITLHTQKYGVVEVKPLGMIWGKLPQYSSKNTIMFDDLRRNFLMNPQSGLKIRPYKKRKRETDNELFHLGEYLERIAELEDFTVLDHSKWEKYLKRKRGGGNADSNPA